VWKINYADITYPKRHCQILRLWGTVSESYNLCGKMLGEVESVQPTFFKQADRLANMTHLLLSIWRRNIKEPAHVSAPTEDTRSYETSHTAFALMLRYNNNQPIRYNTVTSLIGGRVEKIVKPIFATISLRRPEQQRLVLPYADYRMQFAMVQQSRYSLLR
jgi:hypothetical protein